MFDSPKLKLDVISSMMNFAYELLQELPNKLRLFIKLRKILGI